MRFVFIPIKTKPKANRLASVMLMLNKTQKMRQPGTEQVTDREMSVKGANMYFMLGHMGALGFVAYANGTLGLPSPDMVSGSGNIIGYELQPGVETGLTYNGTLAMAGGRLNFSLPSGSAYTVLVVTNSGISTASGISTT